MLMLSYLTSAASEPRGSNPRGSLGQCRTSAHSDADAPVPFTFLTSFFKEQSRWVAKRAGAPAMRRRAPRSSAWPSPGSSSSRSASMAWTFPGSRSHPPGGSTAWQPPEGASSTQTVVVRPLPRRLHLGWESGTKQWAGRPLSEEIEAWRVHQAGLRAQEARASWPAQAKARC